MILFRFLGIEIFKTARKNNNSTHFLGKLKKGIFKVYSDILINDLRVTSELQVLISIFLLHELQVTFCIGVTSYCLLHELRVSF